MLIIRRESCASDLGRIVDHIALDNPAVALDMWDEIEGQVERLRDFPRSGRTGRLQDTKELVVAGTTYIVVYLITDDVELIRVLPTRRNGRLPTHARFSNEMGFE